MAQSNTARAPKRLLEGTRLRLASLLHAPAATAPQPSAASPGLRPLLPAVSSAPAPGKRPSPKPAGRALGMARHTVVLMPAPPTIKRPMSRPVFLPVPQAPPPGYTPAVKPADFLRMMAERERPEWRGQIQPMKVLAIGLCISTVILGFAGGTSFSGQEPQGPSSATAHAAVAAEARVDGTPLAGSETEASAEATPVLVAVRRPKRGVIIEPLAPKYADAVLHVRISEAVVLTPDKPMLKKVRAKRGKAHRARRRR